MAGYRPSGTPLVPEGAWNPECAWGPQPCDDAASFHWFGLFLYNLTTPRRGWMSALGRMGCRVGAGTLGLWHHGAHWAARADAYDRHVIEAMRRAREAEVETLVDGIARRHAAAKAWTTLAQREVEKLLEEQSRSVASGTVRAELALRAMVRGIDSEHRALGIAVPEVSTSTDYSRLSDEELSSLVAMQAKATVPP